MDSLKRGLQKKRANEKALPISKPRQERDELAPLLVTPIDERSPVLSPSASMDGEVFASEPEAQVVPDEAPVGLASSATKVALEDHSIDSYGESPHSQENLSLPVEVERALEAMHPPGLLPVDLAIDPGSSLSSVVPVEGGQNEVLLIDDNAAEPAWLADLEEAEASAASAVVEVFEDDELEDILDKDEQLAQTAQEEVEELIPSIEVCLEQIDQRKPGVIQELDRLVHTLKGVAGMAGAMRTRSLIHKMESLTSEVKEGRTLDMALLDRLKDMFVRVKQQLDVFFHPPAEPVDGEASVASNSRGRSVRVSTETLDRLYNENNEARLSGKALLSQVLGMRRQLRDMEDTAARISQLARDFEIHAESQIQSHKAQIAESHEGFDPLEMDRFTQMQEMSRLLTEAVGDIQDQQQDMVRAVSEQETGLAYQSRAIEEVQDGLYQSRLVVVENEINDALHKVALNTARETQKSVSFSLAGGQVPLDRALLARVREPLSHIIRNAVAHGIESPEARLAAGKPAMGALRLAVQKEAGRAIFVVEDDGAGLNIDRIRQRAIENKLWPESKPMDARQAADVICLPGFSTAEKVTQVAGRGVGMDVVRNEVLSMGGRFDMSSRTGRGLRVVLQIPTTVAAASVLMVDAGGETWSVPIEIIRDVTILRGVELQQARETGATTIGGREMPFAALDFLMGAVDPSVLPQDSAPVLLLEEGDRQVAVEASRLRQVAELPLRTLGGLWSQTPGIIGATLLPDGQASFLVDPLRAPWGQAQALPVEPQSHAAPVVRPPMVLVVDDSITVRKATARFLERVGYEPYLAKDGQEALEALAQIQPAAMLLDVEMPRMNGFDCARNVRENPRYANLPIIMITSRMAEKHRERARDLGINEYLGKPFQEDELLALLQHYIQPAHTSN